MAKLTESVSVACDPVFGKLADNFANSLGFSTHNEWARHELAEEFGLLVELEESFQRKPKTQDSLHTSKNYSRFTFICTKRFKSTLRKRAKKVGFGSKYGEYFRAFLASRIGLL